MTEQATSAPSVALLGTGIMGAGMARSMLRAGIPLRVWNRTRSRAEPLEADGAIVSDSPAEAVRGADIIVTMLADGPAVLDAMTAAVPGLSPGQIWAQTSTVGVSWLEELAEFARDRGIVFLDAPVLGTREPAERGQLTVFAAGPGEASESIRERVRPVLEAIGQKTVWLDEVGTATRLKLVANSWVVALTNAIGESVALARGLGVDPEAFLRAMSGGPLDCTYLHVKGHAILSNDFTPSFSAALAGKDAGLVVEAAEAAGLRLDGASAVRERFRRAAALGHGEDDMAAVYFASFDGAATQ
jgi:3-hydroxyisobutyrate dehydrogenase